VQEEERVVGKVAAEGKAAVADSGKAKGRVAAWHRGKAADEISQRECPTGPMGWGR